MLINFILCVGILVLLYLLIIMPKLSYHPDRDKFDSWFYAHRGLHDNQSKAPENSLASFREAVINHYGIEMDVQLTKDGVPVIHHDYDLMRSCGVDYKVSELTYEKLSDYRLFKSQEKIPTLEEALAVVNGKVPLIIELKIPWDARPLCTKVSDILKGYKGLYCIESFNPFGLMWYRKHEPKVMRGQLSTDFIKEKIEGSRMQYFILKHLLMNFLTKPDFIAYQHFYRNSLSLTLCRKLYRTQTFAWTIQSQSELEDNKNYFDLFIFENFMPKQDKKSCGNS